MIVAAKRARQINNYHHQLGEGTFDEFPPPLVRSRSKNYLTMSLEEIAEGKISYRLSGRLTPPRSAEVPRVLTGTIRRMSRILLGVTGGIAAYKACELTRLLVKAGHEVIPLVTPGAERFVRAETFQALARRPANEDVYLHLTHADLLVIAPCTANTLAKLAHGISDNLAHRGRAGASRPGARRPGDEPADVGCTRRPARTQKRCSRAASSSSAPTRARRRKASGEWAGWPSPRRSPARAEQLLAPGPLAGKRILVTAGGTREPLDAARFVGNRSSGRMGVALAEEARRRGADVVLLAANLAVPAPPGVETIPTADRGGDARRRARARRRRHRPARGRRCRLPARAALAGKRAKSDEPWTRRARADRRHRPPPRRGASVPASCSSPSAPTLGDEGLERKRGMLETKNADLVVYNDVSRADIAFESADNEVVLVSRLGERDRAEGAEAPRSRRRSSTRWSDCSMTEAYDLFQEGRERLKKGMNAQATVPLEKAKKLEPDKASIREALGIAYFRLRRWDEAEAEFRAVLELSPTDDYAHYALGRALEKQGKRRRGERALQARELDEPGERGLRRPHPRARLAARCARSSSGLARPRDARRRDRRRASSCSSASPRPTTPPAPTGWPARSPASASSRATDGKFDRSLLDTGGAALVVSQFTLIADTAQGQPPELRRGGEAGARRAALRALLPPRSARSASRSRPASSAPGWQVELVNDGPVTIVLE